MSIAISNTAASESRVRNAINQAATRTGVDFNYLYNQARIESSLNPAARARTSSAAGLYQFTRQTWLQVVKAHGSDHGIGWAADAIERSGNGHAVADPSMRSTIDDLRFDPELSSAMAGEFASDNRDRLESALGRSAEPVDLYLAHFLGAKGASDFLTAHDANPDSAAAPMFPAAAAANRSIFYQSDGSARTLGDIRASFAAKLQNEPGLPTSNPVQPSSSWTQTRRVVADAPARAPMQMVTIEPIPPRLSIDFAARAYRRLEGLGA